DGTLSIVPEGAQPNSQVAVDRIRLLNPDRDAVAKGADGLFRSSEPLTPDASVRLIPASLEGSNVNAVGEMVRMIELSRQFENQIKLMTTAQEMDASSAQLMRLE
ncbi:MAG: flagellar basal body rod C-terminal domain-containing protein, partial [Parahaliea sp.]